VEILSGKGPSDLRDLCDELSAWMFVLGGRTKTVAEGRELAAEMIASGRARDTFREVIRSQGGDPRIVDDPGRLPHAKHWARITAPRAGFVTAIHCERAGVASMMLGGGREKKEDSVDPAVGLVLEKKAGDAVEAGTTLCAVHYNLDSRLAEAMALLEKSFEIGDKAPPVSRLVRQVIGA
jgi:pyrimidine-nucleoside phosphorylase/thymidine phosphorylase